jgi:serine/threonine-protein kinase
VDLDATSFAALNRLLDEALDRPEGERMAWAEGLPAEYDDLKPRLLALLARASGGSSPLDAIPELDLGGEAGDWDESPEGAGPRELVSGEQLGRFQIRELLGVGGMGRVYRAFDPTLAREVAIKTLARAFRRDPASLRRAAREARLLATISHPNVGAIYGFERIDGAPYLILELVEGETLAQRLERGALSAGAAAAVGLQVAAALEEAHRKGIVHRDLKPANVKIGPEGHVKVFDFGIAKPIAPPGADPSRSGSTGGTTGTGIVPGTAPYMSPEQVRGEPVDARADVWAFGCLLYEMISGERAFPGSTAPEIMAAVLRDPVPWERLPPGTPPALLRLMRRCLRRERRDRLQAIGDARLELADLVQGEAAEPARGAIRRSAWPWAVAAVALLVALFFALERAGSRSPLPRVTRLSLELPADLTLAGGYAAPFALAPDASRVALVALKDGVRHLAVRPLDGLEATLLEGTEGAWQPTFSPDGKEIAFFADRKLKKVPAGGGPVIALAEIGENPRGATWGPDGTIVFAESQVSALSRVPAGGGAATPLTRLDLARGESSHRWPQVLPGGRWLLFTTGLDSASFDDARLEVLSLASGERRLLLEGGAHARYAAGALFYAQAGRLLAVPFDPEAAAIRGAPSVVVDEVRYDPRNGGTHFALSDDGTLAYGPGRARPPESYLAWIDPAGRLARLGGPPRRFREPRLSPDGSRVAVVVGPAADADLWIVEVASATFTRASFGLSPHHPTWTPDGRGITVGAEVRGRWQLLTLPAMGSSPALEVHESAHRVYPSAWAPDGRALLFEERRPETGWDVRSIEVAADGRSSGSPKDLAATPFQERNATLSPDGRWLAFESNELDGVNGIYVAPAADPGAKLRATPTFANWPRWGRAGRLYYWYPAQARTGDSPDAEGFYRLDWRAAGPRLAAERPAPVWPPGPPLRGPLDRLILGPYSGFDVDASRPEVRFLVLETSAARIDVPLASPVVVLGGMEELRRRGAP